ncbi:MAG: amidohydrolase family protein [Alphaproteobacteria bacterium]|nr:amidohydrolase family protein [Alphaproteobacteria bacterium]
MLGFLMSLVACARPEAATESDPQVSAPTGDVVLRGAQVVGVGAVDVLVSEGRIAAVGGAMPEDADVIDLSGKWLAPALIDAHVHVAYWQVGDELAAAGLAGAVDLAAPEEWIGRGFEGLEVAWSGPMVTAVGGYPTQTWGRNGYGVECADAQAAVAAVDRLADAGARVIKLPVTASDSHAPETLAAAVTRARERGLVTVSHALGDAEALAARRAGVEVLAHTPTSALSDATVAAWADGAVIATLDAFGGAPATVDNLRRLREAGATVLYGTDLGNARVAGISEDEIARMQDAGMSGAAILEAATRAPAQRFGFDDLGEIAPGKRASLLVLDADPSLSPTTLAHPARVFVADVD